jgi:hypothetical protein
MLSAKDDTDDEVNLNQTARAGTQRDWRNLPFLSDIPDLRLEQEH